MEDLLSRSYPLTYADCVVYLAKPLYYYRRNFLDISGNVVAGSDRTAVSEPVMKQLARYMTVWGMDSQDRPRKAERAQSEKDAHGFFISITSAARTKNKNARSSPIHGASISTGKRAHCRQEPLSLSQRVQLFAY
jgi:hypothetical protein